MKKKAVFKKHKQAIDKIEKKQDEVSHIWLLMARADIKIFYKF